MALLKKKKTAKPSDELLNPQEREADTAKFGVFDAASFYLRLLTDKISKGRTERNTPGYLLGKDKKLGTGQYFYASNRIFTRQGVKKMYFVTRFSPSMDWGWVDDLRERILDEVDEYNGSNGTMYSATVNLLINGEYFNFDYTDRRIQGRWKQLTRVYDKVERTAENRTLEDELKNEKWDEQVRHKVDSFLYMKGRKESGYGFFNSTIALEICVLADWERADDVLYLAEKTLNEYLYEVTIEAKPVFLQANEYQRSFTPAVSPERKSLIKDMNRGNLLTDEILASMTTVEHGKVGDDVGILHGLDIQSNEDVVFDLSKGSDGKNILITAATGQGKSGYTKMLYTFLGKDPKYQTVVFDYEGTEYVPLGNLFGATIVGFDGRSGSYINTLVIDDPVGDPEIDDFRIDESKEATIRVFNILFKNEIGEMGMNDAQLNVFNAVLRECYKKVGVDEKDQSTWGRSKKLTYAYYYRVLEDMINRKDGATTLDLRALSSQRADKDGWGVLHSFKLVLSNYFEVSGAKSSWFKHPVALGDVIRSKNVIFSFNMGQGGESEINTDGQQLALNQLFAGELTLKKARHNKVRGIFTITMIEEMQRYLELRYSKELVSKLVTGGRKLNLINYLITNSPSEMIESAHMTGNTSNKGSASILQNINMYIIGALSKSAMADVIREFGLGNATSYLEDLVNVKESATENNPLKYAFFIKKGNQSTLVKQMIHPALANLPLYKTVEHSVDESDADSQLRKASSMTDEDMFSRINETAESLKESDTKERLNKDVKDNILLRGERKRSKGLFGGD